MLIQEPGAKSQELAVWKSHPIGLYTNPEALEIHQEFFHRAFWEWRGAAMSQKRIDFLFVLQTYVLCLVAKGMVSVESATAVTALGCALPEDQVPEGTLAGVRQFTFDSIKTLGGT